MDKDKQSLVSIIIPTHNRSALLLRAIDSVINQTYKNIEIIIADDGSTDDTEEKVKEIITQHNAIIYLKNTTPKGANVARNKAIKAAHGTFITGLDDDDEMMPDRIEKMLLHYDPNFAYVFTGYKLITETTTKDILPHTAIITRNKMLCSNITGSQVLTKKEIFIKAGLYDESLSAAQDYDMWLRILEITPRAKAIKEPLMRVYSGHEQISTSSYKIKGYLQCYHKHKKKMTDHQRKMRLFEIRHKIKKHTITVKALMFFFPLKEWPIQLLVLIKKRIVSA